jgi:hypothetical protein
MIHRRPLYSKSRSFELDGVARGYRLLNGAKSDIRQTNSK